MSKMENWIQRSWGAAAGLLLALSAPLSGQQVPQLPAGVTPGQAVDMLERQPALGGIVQRRLQESGLSPDEIRAQLRAAGYPGNTLDAYLDLEATELPDPGANTLPALRAISLGRFSAQDSLLLSGDSVALRMFSDSLRADSIRQSEEFARLNRPFELFGLNTFRNATTSFQPITTGPVDRNYRVGSGDVLVLILSGQVERAHTLEVTGEGFVFIPQVGQVFVNNLSLDQIDAVLFDRLRQVYSGVSRSPNPGTRFEVAVSRVRTISVRVTGEVAVPGTYQISAAGGPLASIYDAGGLLETSNFRRVEVRRGEDLAFTIDLYDFLTRGVIPQGTRLQSGDVVFVPPRGSRVKVAGEVVRPGIYEVAPGETVADLIRFAGGLSESAATTNASLDRILPPASRTERGRQRTVLTIDLASALDSTIPGVQLIGGDSLTVYRIPNIVGQFVTIEGAVWQPGTYNLEPGMRLNDLVQVAGGLRPESYAGRAQVLRTRSDSTTMLIGAALRESAAGGSFNPELEESDQVTVFSEATFRSERYIAVWGEVRQPGILAFSDSMTLRDAVLLAGGVTDGAYLLQAEVSRLNENGSGGDSLVMIVSTPLDTTYLMGLEGYRHRAAMTGQAPGVTLHPYDNVFIRREPGWETQRNVVVTGELRFAGRYSLVSRDERLLSVIQRAGGLTSEAYANGIQFFRNQGRAGRIAVDLPAVLTDPGHKDNLSLISGDSIHIPRYVPTVRVEGAVNSPSSVAYEQGRDMRYYIDAAGGYARLADRGRRYVQQPNGLIQRDANPEPGAVLVVPAKDPDDRGVDLVALITGVAGVLASLVTVIVVLAR